MAANDEMLEREIPHEVFPWGRVDRFVAGVVNEVSHHGTQICMLRDMYGHLPGKPASSATFATVSGSAMLS